MRIEVSHGEIVDKLSILNIKKDNIIDEVKHEIVFSDLNINHDDDYLRLLEVNKKLWDIEDKIRDKERNKEFDDEFIELARSVYHTNDIRANIKKEINVKYGSQFVEEKSYNKY